MSKSKQGQQRPASDPTPGGKSSAAANSRRDQLRAQQAAEAQRARTRRIITAAAVALAVLIVAIVAVVLVQNNQRQLEADSLRGSQGQVTPLNATEDGSGLVYTSSTGSIDKPLVEVYLDFQCPGCAQASAVVDPLLEQLAESGKIQLTYHMLYGLDRGFPGNHSYRAALAATCADVQDAFSAYTKTVFANQPVREGDGWTDEQLRGTLAQQAGLAGEQLTAFQGCYDAKSTSDFVEAMYNATPDYVTHTPFFAVDGKEMPIANADLASQDALLSAIERIAG